MTLTEEVTKNIIKRLLRGEDYRIEVVILINAKFLHFAIDFFKKITEAKLKSQDITFDWYKESFLHPKLSSKEIAINAGLNKKTINNMFNSAKKEIVIDASNEHYDLLYQSINKLVDNESDLELYLTIKFKNVSVDLNISESLIVINTLAVKRAELRGGLWSTAGKKVEKPLMQVLCKLCRVPENNYSLKIKGNKLSKDEFQREVDFYLNSVSKSYKCEVKLMGKGNPESADVVIARGSKVFVADRLKVQWVELRSNNSLKQFLNVLASLKIPHSSFQNPTEKVLDEIFKEIHF